jgi:HK97 family phage major capsid protein
MLCFCVLKEGAHMTTDPRQDAARRRDELLSKARELCEKAKTEDRELTDDEQAQVDTAINESKSINEKLAADAKHRGIMEQLDAMASATSDVLGGGGRRIALTGVHQKHMTDKIIAAMPRDPSGSKALVTGGTQAVSTILLPEVVATGRPAVSVLDILPSRIVPPVYFFLRQNSRNLAAAPTPAGSAKPVSDVGVTGVSNRLRVVATVSSALDHFLLQDNSNLAAFVGEELVYAIRVALENEILNGDGTAEHFTGILNTSGILAQAFSTNTLTSVRKAITTLDGQNYTPSVLVLHGNDWEAVELLAASTGSIDTRGVPIDPIARRLWGVPVVVNNTMPAKVGLLLSEGSVIVDHDGRVETKWFDSANDDILKNQLRCRVEGRWGVSVVQPGSVVKIATAA